MDHKRVDVLFPNKHFKTVRLPNYYLHDLWHSIEFRHTLAFKKSVESQLGTFKESDGVIMPRFCYGGSEEVVMTKQLKSANILYNKCVFTNARMKEGSLSSEKNRSINEVKKTNSTDSANKKPKSKRD